MLSSLSTMDGVNTVYAGAINCIHPIIYKYINSWASSLDGRPYKPFALSIYNLIFPTTMIRERNKCRIIFKLTIDCYKLICSGNHSANSGHATKINTMTNMAATNGNAPMMTSLAGPFSRTP